MAPGVTIGRTVMRVRMGITAMVVAVGVALPLAMLMLMFTSMVVSVVLSRAMFMVIVARIRDRPVHDNVELGRVDTGTNDATESDVDAVQTQPPDLGPQIVEVDTEVEERTDGHVSADPRKAIKIKGFHWHSARTGNPLSYLNAQRRRKPARRPERSFHRAPA
jgi:hypothetical protein